MGKVVGVKFELGVSTSNSTAIRRKIYFTISWPVCMSYQTQTKLIPQFAYYSTLSAFRRYFLKENAYTSPSKGGLGFGRNEMRLT